MEVTVKPAGELGSVCPEGQKLTAHLRLDLTPMLLEGTEDAQHHWQRLTGAEISVISFARFEPTAEVIDHRAVEITVSVIQSGGNVLHLVQAELG